LRSVGFKVKLAASLTSLLEEIAMNGQRGRPRQNKVIAQVHEIVAKTVF